MFPRPIKATLSPAIFTGRTAGYEIYSRTKVEKKLFGDGNSRCLFLLYENNCGAQ
jgi:hypothetical protein